SSNSRPPSFAASGWPAAAVASSSPPPPCPQLFSSSLRTTGARSPRYGCASVWASGPGREEEDDVRERGGLSEAHLPRRSRSISARLTSSSASGASMAGRDDSSWYGRVSSSSASTVAWKYTDLSSGGDSSDSDTEVEIPEGLDEKEVETPAVKDESQSEYITPADSSARLFSSKEESLVQATLSSMVKKAEEKKMQV
ncbi:unnamed protein product, partial [Urochloa humidicola]